MKLICFFSGRYAYAAWQDNFIASEPSIALLELSGIVLAVATWADKLRKKSITVHSDNQAAVAIVNSFTSGCKRCMTLVRILVEVLMKFDIKLKALYVPGINNELADSLSRLKIDLFFKQAKQQGFAELHRDQFPDWLWPIYPNMLNS